MDESISTSAHQQTLQPNHRLFWWVIVFVAAAWLCFHLFTTHEMEHGAYGQAAKLNRLLQQDSRFSEVAALCVAGTSIVVVALDTLPPKTKMDLEHFVRHHSPIPNTPINYGPVGTRPNDSPSNP